MACYHGIKFTTEDTCEHESDFECNGGLDAIEVSTTDVVLPMCWKMGVVINRELAFVSITAPQ